MVSRIPPEATAVLRVYREEVPPNIQEGQKLCEDLHLKHSSGEPWEGGGWVGMGNESAEGDWVWLHAPRRDLIKVAEKFDAKNMVFVHGDPPAVQWMSENCGNGCLKFTPEIGETIQLKS